MRYENLQEDFSTVCDMLGIERMVLPHRNKSSKEHFSRYYDDELAQIVAKKFAAEISFGGYQLK